MQCRSLWLFDTTVYNPSIGSADHISDVAKRIRQSSRRQASEEAQQLEKQLEKKENQRRRELISKRRQIQSQLALKLGLRKDESEPDATDREHDMPPFEGIHNFFIHYQDVQSALLVGHAEEVVGIQKLPQAGKAEVRNNPANIKGVYVAVGVDFVL